MLRLPEKFLDRMKKQLGEEYSEFLSCYERDDYAGLRVNTGKISVEDFLSITPFRLTRIPWTENGFYYNKDEAVTRHPHYYAGLYYIQEPSAMLPAASLPVEPGTMVLDLCAAPGGKATELSSRMGGSGLLIANDVSASRAKALVKNLSVWGSRNACITGEAPEKLVRTFGCSFDRILVDAPCSGEGMFRKDEGLIVSWEERGPEVYAPLQIQILNSAVQMLKPGGFLLYSTCTFSQEEDEQVICEILDRFSDLHLVDIESAEQFSGGDAPCEKTIRVWPHRIKGEGHYLALLQKNEGSESISSSVLKPFSEQELAVSKKKIPKEVVDFMGNLNIDPFDKHIYQQIGDQCYFLPPFHLPKGLRYLRTGIAFGELKKGRFEPGQALAMMLNQTEYKNSISLNSADDRILRYLKGETIELSVEECISLKKGWTLVCVDGFGLGWGKFTGDTVKNKYYPGWRMM